MSPLYPFPCWSRKQGNISYDYKFGDVLLAFWEGCNLISFELSFALLSAFLINLRFKVSSNRLKTTKLVPCHKPIFRDLPQP